MSMSDSFQNKDINEFISSFFLSILYLGMYLAIWGQMPGIVNEKFQRLWILFYFFRENLYYILLGRQNGGKSE